MEVDCVSLKAPRPRTIRRNGSTMRKTILLTLSWLALAYEAP